MCHTLVSRLSWVTYSEMMAFAFLSCGVPLASIWVQPKQMLELQTWQENGRIFRFLEQTMGGRSWQGMQTACKAH